MEIRKSLTRPISDSKFRQGHEVVLAEESVEIEGEFAKLILTVDALQPVQSALLEVASGDVSTAETLKLYIQQCGVGQSNGHLPSLQIKGKRFDLKEGTHYTHVV